jgi:hypothetical protein
MSCFSMELEHERELPGLLIANKSLVFDILYHHYKYKQHTRYLMVVHSLIVSLTKLNNTQ